MDLACEPSHPTPFQPVLGSYQMGICGSMSRGADRQRCGSRRVLRLDPDLRVALATDRRRPTSAGTDERLTGKVKYTFPTLREAVMAFPAKGRESLGKP